MDREKVIKGLQAHADGCGYRSHYCDAMECPYRYGDESCDIEEMCRDALALLKEKHPKTGHWIEQEDYALDTYYDCSVCGESWSTVEGTPWGNGMNYCPHCGAKMECR